jgi:TonB-linked SusC/RagA family outer membrane protein
MKSKFTGILTLFLAFFIQFSFAQEKTITGAVVSEDDQMGLPGVNVTVQGTTRGVQTDFDGNFSITAAEGEKLVFSFMGMATQVITVGSSNVVNVTMKSDNVLDVVSIEGYRTTSKPLSNVAAVTVTSKTIEGRPNASFIQTLQGQVPGLNIMTGSGQPGANATVILRGYGSINGNVEPLYIIDGVPQNEDIFRSINPNEIESVSVLKDAGATAVYGNRGANGVIVVYTKKGDFNSDLSIKYAAFSGFSTIQDQNYRLANSREHLQLQKIYGVGLGNTLTDEQINSYAIDTNWEDEFFRQGLYQNHNISLTGGGKNLTSFTSLGYMEQEGIAVKTDLKRFNFRNNLSGKSANDKFNYSTSIGVGFSKVNNLPDEGTGFVNSNPLMGALNSVPYVSPSWYENGLQVYNTYTAPAANPALFPAGDLMVPITPGSMAITPLLLLDRLSNNYRTGFNEIKSIANMQGSYKITDDISVSSTLGMDFLEQQSLTFEGPESFNAYLWWPESQGYQYRGRQQENMVRQFTVTNTNRINFNKTFAEKHTVDVSVFTEYLKAHAKSFGYTQTGLDPKLAHPGAGTGFIAHNPDDNPRFYVPGRSSGKTTAGLFSYFAMADYDYNKKYGFSTSIRRDASYRFSSSNRWGTFWSVAGRWNLDQEDFMNDTGFQMLKLRASYGTTGNQNIVGQSIFAGTSLTRTLYASGRGYTNQNAYVLGQLGNDDLMWETIAQANIGVDFAVFNSRLRGSLDVYEKRTQDMYLPTPLSAVTGFSELNANNGVMTNKGIEAILFYDVFKSDSDFQLTLSANGSYNKNEVLELPTEDGTLQLSDIQAVAEGHQLLEFTLIKYAGVNPATGNMLFYTADGELTENPNIQDDRVYTGKSRIPAYQGGFGFNASYKNFFLSTQFNFVADIWRIDNNLDSVLDPTSLGQFNASTDLFNAWTPDNRYTDIPSLNYANATFNDYSDRFLVDASYLRLRYISFGYEFSKELLGKTPIDNLRIFAQGENLLTWSKWRGWDAESNRGGDFNDYPTPRIVSLGLEVQF